LKKLFVRKLNYLFKFIIMNMNITFNRASIRNLKHKTKKGMMKRIGMTESRPEDPEFKNLLAKLSKFKTELREIYSTSGNVAVSGEQFHKELEKFCGLGLRTEQVFFKEEEFINFLREGVCSALRKVAVEDINTLDEYIVRYKTAKLAFDATYFKTVKRMRKHGGSEASESEEIVLQNNSDLPALQQAYVASKEVVLSQYRVMISNLKKRVGQRLQELREVSPALHHQLCVQYFAQRLIQALEICDEKARSEQSELLDAAATSKGSILNDKKLMSKTESGSEASSLETGAGLSQWIDPRAKKDIDVADNKEIMFNEEEGERLEGKEGKCDSVKSLPNTPEPVGSEVGVEKELQDPESNRTTSYQCVDTQESSREEGLKVGVVG